MLDVVNHLLNDLALKYFLYVLATYDVETSKGNSNHEEDKKVPYPKQIFCIVSMEACERFSFYGMNSKSVYKQIEELPI